MLSLRINVDNYQYYPLEVAGLKRNLPICKVNDDLYIAAFVIFGDVELTKACATELIKKMPEFDVLVTAESKGIPLAYEIARQLGLDNYIIARKTAKLYMKTPVAVHLHSITTAHTQTLYLDKSDMDYIKGKRVVIADDVISTGESLSAIEKLIIQSGGNIVAKMAILVEGDAADRKDIIALQELPLFIPDNKQ
ncbi:MAG: adenine phosphoribosyltransferase [Clostridiales bacterium GWF2_38_85]|nr:MAG: adenine phosphoribosyltransferase [Clostridiales bacterium GWF2_38_85]HBL84062.1 adenine phosphoribosyltransferase [Clostridiales bacterium]